MWHARQATGAEPNSGDVARLCDDDTVRQRIATASGLDRIDRLAELLAHALAGDCTLEEALSNYSVSTGEAVARWFAEHEDVRDRALYLSLAVLSGVGVMAIETATNRLIDLLRAGVESPGAELPLGTERSSRFSRCSAKTVPGYEDSEFGPSPTKLVMMESPALQIAVLNHVWTECDGFDSALLEWLDALGRDPAPAVRYRAAAAVGRLAVHDFAEVTRRVISSWANAEEHNVRDAAAFALDGPSNSDEVVPLVERLLRRWSHSNAPELQWVAAMAYGGAFGQRFPFEAMRRLGRLAHNGGRLTLWGVHDSILLLARGDGEARLLPDQILQEVLGWAERTDDSQLNWFSLFVFVSLMREASADSELWDALDRDESREAWAALWVHAQRSRTSRDRGFEALRLMVQRADGDHVAYERTERLLLASAAGHDGLVVTDVTKRTIFNLSRWATEGGRGSAPAKRLLKKLRDIEVRQEANG